MLVTLAVGSNIFVHLRILITSPPDVVIILHQGDFVYCPVLLVLFNVRGALFYFIISYSLISAIRSLASLIDPEALLFELDCFSLA